MEVAPSAMRAPSLHGTILRPVPDPARDHGAKEELKENALIPLKSTMAPKKP
jgi:hypothetical protein